ncbi:hypothetical protein N7468_003274 [Penicillium chermesinum]|uniref:Uncharacterized protein n=1 Tax=Penicillium chermesinum TaxID=63820 RepID=A0A9W9P6D9_9EURO|nr:uncharacterized protein N7468_003274 [Penicillium chermesinum]KAJ5238655.1 hypothetical protein N7468_003274 [Penicillium chermesinum]
MWERKLSAQQGKSAIPRGTSTWIVSRAIGVHSVELVPLRLPTLASPALETPNPHESRNPQDALGDSSLLEACHPLDLSIPAGQTCLLVKLLAWAFIPLPIS